MCTNPTPIANLNRGIKNKAGLNKYKDTKSAYLYVPCGWCEECIAVKQMGYIQRIMLESINNHIFMIMYSYNEEMIPKMELNGYTFRYADIHDFTLMAKRLKKWRDEKNKKHSYINHNWRYFGVTELGGKKGRPHFHIFILIPKKELPEYADVTREEKHLRKVMLENWQRNVGTTRNPIYKDLCTYHECWRNGILHRNYDCKWINPGQTKEGIADPAWYIMKYALKDSGKERRRQQALKLNLPEKEYLEAWNTIKTQAFFSKYFGYNADTDKCINPFGDIEIDKDIYNYLRKCIEFGKGKFDYPVFINPNNGKTFPLSNYYRKNDTLFTLKDYADYYPNGYNYIMENSYYENEEHKRRVYKTRKIKANRIWNIQNHTMLDDVLEELNK